jgi:hypothetical protein
MKARRGASSLHFLGTEKSTGKAFLGSKIDKEGAGRKVGIPFGEGGGNVPGSRAAPLALT